MSTSKSCFIMSMTACGPLLNRLLICTVLPGRVVHEQVAREADTRRLVFVSGSMWRTIIVSERCPPSAAAVPNAWAWPASCTKARLSEPMMR